MPARKLFAAVGIAAATMLPAYTADASTLTTLCSFGGGADGTDPNQLTYRAGILYGTTYAGGQGCGRLGCGTVFEVDATTGAKTILHMFHGRARGGGSGSFPSSGLVYQNGSLFGTTFSGGTGPNTCNGGCGTVFSVDATTGAETSIYSFPGGAAGSTPSGNLTLSSGALFGTTQVGGSANQGVLFELAPQTFAETTLYAFPGVPNPALPNGGMIYVNQKLYGTTVMGGASYYGTIFDFDTTSGIETTLHDFKGPGRDGALPLAGMVYLRGFLYGATTIGGHAGFGIVFKLDLETGSERVLHNFDNGAGGGTPTGGVIAHDGKLYGTTAYGGASGYGTIYQLDRLAGTQTVLYSFQDGTDGATPTSLIFEDGAFYGTTSGAGGGYGTVFKFMP